MIRRGPVAGAPGEQEPASEMVGERYYRILVRDLVLMCSIGAYPQERLQRQRVRFNVDLHALWPAGAFEDDLDQVVNYKDITNGIRDLIEHGHINLVETLAQSIAEMCLADARVIDARVRVEKLDVEPDADGIGIEIERHRPSYPAVTDLFARLVTTSESKRHGDGGES
jgi:7,8-dihydroneopterin aldolase/epimerase/oxygenase